MSALGMITRAMRVLPPETAHGLTLRALKLLPLAAAAADDPILRATVFDKDFRNPIGLAAGFDKDAEVIKPVLGLGFGFVEVGSVTPEPQFGNPRPRIFRLREDRAVINRLGFNSRGADVVAGRLRRYRKRNGGLVGVNLGKNKDSDNASADYAAAAEKLAPYADYLVLNVSSPNTPGLRTLQRIQELDSILAEVKKSVGHPRPPILIKVAPDLTDDDKEDIAVAVPRWQVAGLIISNTTVARPEALKSPRKNEAGGLSGPPLFPMSTEALREMYALTSGRVPLVGVGGVASGADAYAKIRAGASLVQLYTGLVYRGPGLVADIKRDLATLLRRDGFENVADAVGADHA